jgi:uncharacterized protein with HEPN domain
LSPAFKLLSSEQIPWASIRGMRNIVAHAYETLKIEEVWHIATIDIPVLKQFCEQTIAEANNI